jgi:hypothetical protein
LSDLRGDRSNCQGRPGNASVMRGFLYGLGAAAACSVGYAIITMATNMQFALIAIWWDTW